MSDPRRFSVDRDVYLMGCVIFPLYNYAGECTVTITVIEAETQTQLINDDTNAVLNTSTNKLEVKSNKPAQIEKGKMYRIVITTLSNVRNSFILINILCTQLIKREKITQWRKKCLV